MEIINTLLLKVEKLNDEKKYLEAIAILEDDLLDKSNDINLYLEKARALGNLKRNNECLIYVNKIIDLDIKNSQANYYLGNLFFDNKELDKALKHYKIALEKDLKHNNAYNGIGNVYSAMKDYQNAIHCYNKAIEIDEKNTYSYSGLGHIYSNLKDHDKAVDNYKKAIKADPSYAPPYNGLGNLNKDKGNYKEALVNFNKYIKLDPNWSGVYYNRAETYFLLENYKKALADYKKYILSAEEKSDFFYKRTSSRIEEINRILSNKHYEEISEIISKIKEILIYNEGCVTHFTSLSVSKLLVIKNSSLRLSEGAFLNDTSEGAILFKYLNFKSNTIKDVDTIDETFTQKPFIGSFVSETKHNDLAMWRMYGKEKHEEAKGCAITIDIKKYKDYIFDLLGFDDSLTSNQDFKFYRVCYIEEDEKFIIPDIRNKDKKEKELNILMEKLKIAILKYEKNGEFKDINQIEELLNEVSFLVKTSEYSYEKEIRLVIKGVGFEKKIEFEESPKVYIELASLGGCIKKITLGPKVVKSDEWASVFHYCMENEGYEPEIHISHLPYK